jgi:hypothetical protein
MIRNRVFAGLAYLSMLAFFAVLLWFVPRLDLAIAVVIGLVLAAYDLWTQLRFRRRS